MVGKEGVYDKGMVQCTSNINFTSCESDGDLQLQVFLVRIFKTFKLFERLSQIYLSVPIL
jgi:hypothetical protein